MKEFIALALICVVVISCKNDDDAPIKPVDVALNGTATEFTDFKATDVGNGIDINLKSSDVEIAIRLEGKTSASYDVANLTGENSFTFKNSVIVLTSLKQGPQVSRGGNVVLTAENGKVSGTITATVTDGTNVSTNIEGSFNEISLGDQSALGCMVEKISDEGGDFEFRYDANGILTEERRIVDQVVATRWIFSYLNGLAVQVVQVGQDIHKDYRTEYSGTKLSKITRLSGANVLTNFTYNGSGEITKVSTNDLNPPPPVCFAYSGDSPTGEIDCDTEAVRVSYNFDDKSSPYALIKASLYNKDAIFYIVHPFGGYFSSHNITDYSTYKGVVTTVTYEYNENGYPTESETTVTSVGTETKTTTTYAYRNCK